MPILTVDGTKYQLSKLTPQDSSWTVSVRGEKITLRILREISAEPLVLLVQSGTRVIRVAARRIEDHDSYLVELNGNPLIVEIEYDEARSLTGHSDASVGPLTVRSPMAGKIVGVKASVGDVVEEGESLVMLEAMKMENIIAAPKRGTVKEVYVRVGALAKPGEKLVLME